MTVVERPNSRDRGLIGPARIFGLGSPYRHILWALLAGAILPIIIWAVGRRWKIANTRLPNIPVMLTGASYIPPATGINYSSWFLAGFVFREGMQCFRLRSGMLTSCCRISRTTLPIPLVVEILLRHIGCPGQRHNHRDDCHLLVSAAAEVWHTVPQLVGQYSLYRNV
jgi:hypothetical protein